MADKNDSFQELMRIQGYLCGDAPCSAGKTGNCSMAKMIASQSKQGSNHPEGNDIWYRDEWENVVKNVKETAEGKCIYPEQLEFAIENFTPRGFIER